MDKFSISDQHIFRIKQTIYFSHVFMLADPRRFREVWSEKLDLDFLGRHHILEGHHFFIDFGKL